MINPLALLFAFAAGYLLCIATTPEPATLPDYDDSRWVYEPSLN